MNRLLCDLVAAPPAGLATGSIGLAVPGIVDEGEGRRNVDDAVVALPFALCAQLLGLHFSLALGRTPDNPFPAGQVNRVVQGVTIHPLSDD